VVSHAGTPQHGHRAGAESPRIPRLLPGIGQEVAFRERLPHSSAVPIDPELTERIAASTGLSPAEATRVIEDVLAYHAEPVEEFVRRRHAHLKTYGAKNAEIFARIAAELADRVVAAPALTERQLRRLVYG
jgi:hypothetical protein